MGRRKSSGRRTPRESLWQMGMKSLVVGVGLLFAPAFMGNSPVTRALAGPLRSLALVALLLAGGLLAVHYVSRRLSGEKLPAVIDRTPSARREPSVPREPTFTDGGAAPSRPWASPQAAGAGVARSVVPRAPNASEPCGRRRETAWSAKVLEDIEWRRFEAVCEALFAQGGFETRSQSHGADGGVDIWLHSKNSTGPAAVVQCKHWTKPVGVKEVREFFGVMASHRLQRGTYVATSGFTPDAQKFAKENGINAMAGDRLLTLIASRTPEQQRDLLNVAYEGEYWRPTCASCGPKMVERPGGKGRPPFWGCINFPRCRSTLSMRQPA
jgi:restriction system protein